MNLSFENKVALVTGAGAGMGLAAARAFVESGAAVAMVDINEAAVRAAGEQLSAEGHKILALRCDVADDAQVQAMVEETVSTFGRLDAAFNNAGVQSPAVEIADSTSEEFDRVTAINLRSVWSCWDTDLLCFVHQNDKRQFIAFARLKVNVMNRLNVTAFPHVHVYVGVRRKLL